MNILAVSSTLWCAFVGITEFLRFSFGEEHIYPIIVAGIFIFFFGLLLVFVAYKLLVRLDKPLSESEKVKKQQHIWRFLPTTELFANFALFRYIFMLQCFYFA